MLKESITIEGYKPEVLHQYIASFNIYWFQGDQDIRLFPKGVFEIVFQSNDHFEHHTSYSSGWEARPKDFIGGLHNKSYLVKPNGAKNCCIVVEFKPDTAKYFIPYKLHDFQNSVIDIFEIWGTATHDLSRKINREANNRRKIKLIESFLLDKFITQKKSTIDHVIPLILASNGFVKVNELAVNAALSTAQFRKRFREEIGLSPSQYCKIIRIKSALRILEKKDNKTLTELTYDLGYFDQAHFIKDFKSIAGLSPKKIRQALK